MKKKKKQNIAISIIGVTIIGLVIAYNYSAEQTKIKGFTFGKELEQIQEDLKKLQTNFSSKVVSWKEEEITTNEILAHSVDHVIKMEQLISRYDALLPPEPFTSSVELFKLSAETQLASDKEFIQWIESGDESNSIRSDALLQESFEYEMAALAKFNEVKRGNIP